MFDEFIRKNPECARKVQAAGDKLNLGSYLNTPWKIVDTYPDLYDTPGVIPFQSGANSVPRNYFDNLHPAWAAATLFDSTSDPPVRGGTYLSEKYHYYNKWVPDDEWKPGRPQFTRHQATDLMKQVTLFDESLHNYFNAGHQQIADYLGVDIRGKDPGGALDTWARGGCK